MKLNNILLVSGLALASIPATAAVRQGLWELGVSASYQNNNVDIDIEEGDADVSTDADSLSLTGSAGYFVTNNLEVTGFGTYIQQDFGDGSTDTLLIGTAVDWHFMTESNFVPYVGIGGAYANIDVGDLGDEAGEVSEDDFIIQGRVGVKQFVADNIALRYQVEWNQGDNTESLGASLGIATFF